MKIARALCVALILLPTVALAWWNKDWAQRTVVALNTSSAGVAISGALTGVPIPIRLHSGNFDFVAARPDGSDLRVVAGDDKTPLKFWIERFDSVNELAVVWVQVPSVLPGTDKNTIYVYGGNDKATADANAAGTAAIIGDAATVAAFHFSEKDGIASDQTGLIKASAATALEVNGLIGQSARLTGTPIIIPANDKLKFGSDAPFTVSLWVRPDTVAGIVYAQGPLQLTLTGGKLTAKLGDVTVAGDVPAATWSQVVLAAEPGKLGLYVNGVETTQAAPQPHPPIDGEIRIGEGYSGLIDELEMSSLRRSEEWIKLVYSAQSADAKLVASKTENTAGEGTGSGSYFGILFKSLTPDAWVIIGILGVMFLIAVAVMISKSFYVIRTDSANRLFLRQFRESLDVLKIGEAGSERFGGSSIYRLYHAGLRELLKRNVGAVDSAALSGPSLDAVKASIDADSVREGYALNSQMVLLTIAIAGGPFLGLLGTVIGVMITFASIAAAGDVNVNAIAPGIAAALLATVAGLSVAIPSLFGYNYLASRIKTISSDMQIFIDEFVTRVAETYGVK
jgi:biopolymer transport protein ExbB